MLGRHIESNIQSGLKDSPILLINGARQVGKSTLAKMMIGPDHKAHYLSLDDPATLFTATSSPMSFLEGLSGNSIIDEIQRAPQLFLPMKKLVDEQRSGGKFLLTGSANILTLPSLADSLAGRIEIHSLWPLSQGEIRGHKETFIDDCFLSLKWPNASGINWESLMEAVVVGGYPEVLRRQEHKRRRAWFSSYLSSILDRDVRDLAQIEGLKEFPNLLTILAGRVGGLLNFSEISRITKISNSTLKRYIALLEAVFLLSPLPAWYKNFEKRLVKSPKIYLNDTGLVSHLRGINTERLINDRETAGFILENFVVMELRKQQTWSETQPSLYHFRTQTGIEVDIVLEAPDGSIVGIEVKSSSSLKQADFKGLLALQELTGKQFVQGILLYTGTETLQFAPGIWALPVSVLWQV